MKKPNLAKKIRLIDLTKNLTSNQIATRIWSLIGFWGLFNSLGNEKPTIILSIAIRLSQHVDKTAINFYLNSARCSQSSETPILLNLKIDRNGVINEDNWTKIWMAPFLQVMPAANSHKKIKRYLDGQSVRFAHPIQIFNWHGFISESKSFFKDNFIPFLHFLSGGPASFHYKKILSVGGIGKMTCPQHIGLWWKV